jgi:hypothetical protein
MQTSVTIATFGLMVLVIISCTEDLLLPEPNGDIQSKEVLFVFRVTNELLRQS